MFGYVKVYKDELKVKEYDTFRAYYCGLCKTLKSEYGFCSRLGLNYDSVFLALLLSSVTDSPFSCRGERCFVSPFKKKVVANTNGSLSYSAAVMVMLALLKLEDDIRDEHSIKAFFAYVAMLGAKRRVTKKYPALYEKCKDRITALSRLENQKCDSVDALSHEFASMMEILFAPEFIKDEKDRRILGHMGYLLGRFIYILDAYEDLEQDRKKKRFNVFLNTTPDKDALRDSLILTLSSIANSYELLDIQKNKPILDNIIYLGLSKELDHLFDNKGEKHERST